ncbi:VWA domain-containing protein [Sulfurimonas sp. C5]|uniref:vWA domain-containing protein n=1 Tax=Sulfurimonas sp. C5 TaxID=3036947 RepID=UPI0024545932|nr:VWA domain-containing protein [Sulfurimonas sp. C5]MDH4945377.1 VWA domain-containing protein [Sulfurimonas sp. C5]
MSFLNPEYFWLLLFIIVALLKKETLFSRVRVVGYLVTFVLLVIALARPIIEEEPIKSKELLSDVVLGVDLSYSMQSNDILPTRLGFAKEELAKLVKSEQKSRFGVLGFTTNAIILSPLTQDSELLLHLFSSLDENLILTKGSSVLPVLKLARKISSSKKVSLVIFSDGTDNKDFSEEIAFAKENHLIVNIFMTATSFGGTLKTKQGTFLKDENGDIVVSRENSAIESLSNATGGVYTKELSEVKSALEEQRDASFMQENNIIQNKELYYYFIALAILTFLIATTTLKKWVIAFLLLFGIQMQADVLNVLKDPNKLAFDQGVRLYQEGAYEDALERFALVKSNTPHIKAIVFYNRANCLIRLKEFTRARVELLKSLSLEYTQEADENLQHIKGVPDNYEMSTGMQDKKKKSEIAKQRNSSQKKKEGGGSNMQVNTSSSGSGDGGEKVKSSQSKIDLNDAKSKLSSKQYELINKRVVNEKKPW